jgi:signal transduction histidine kinase
MHYYFTVVSLIAGICLGFSVLFLFLGLRRKRDQPLYLTFALFALCYALTLFNGIRWYSSSDAAEFIAINRVDSLFVTGAFVCLIWYISYYTDVRPRIFLWLLSTALVVPAIVFIISPIAFYGEILGLTYIFLPWGEKLVELDAVGSIWGDVLLLARLLTLVYIMFALIRQFRNGSRQPAIILGFGILPFVAGIFYEILGESGFVPFIPFGELGFLGIAVAASLQMSNSVIKTEEELEQYQHNLEGLVAERTAELEAAQGQLVSQVRETAVLEERSRLARDLHDEVTQTIYSASLIAEVLPKVWERDPTEGERDLAKLRQLVRGALAEMRILLFELRPSALKTADFETLIHQLGDTLTGRSRIPVDIVIDENLDLPTEVRIVFFRIVQESFNNILKHSEASVVKVSVIGKPDRVLLKISDNGRGFNPQRVSDGCMGIHIMRERLAGIHADLQIESSPGKGTKLISIWMMDNSRPVL